MAEATVEYADLIGIPFVLGARGPEAYDCYGLLIELYKRLGKAIPDLRSPQSGPLITALATSEVARTWVAVERSTVNSMTLIRTPFSLHVGMALPHGKLIHSWENSGGVVVERLSDWERRIIGHYIYVGN
jgi:cell wall-associated NlpC family hydrolase